MSGAGSHRRAWKAELARRFEGALQQDRGVVGDIGRRRAKPTGAGAAAGAQPKSAAGLGASTSASPSSAVQRRRKIGSSSQVGSHGQTCGWSQEMGTAQHLAWLILMASTHALLSAPPMRTQVALRSAQREVHESHKLDRRIIHGVRTQYPLAGEWRQDRCGPGPRSKNPVCCREKPTSGSNKRGDCIAGSCLASAHSSSWTCSTDVRPPFAEEWRRNMYGPTLAHDRGKLWSRRKHIMSEGGARLVSAEFKSRAQGSAHPARNEYRVQ